MAGPTPEDVFTRHHRDIYRYLVRMTGRPDVADDLSQDVFLRVVRALRNGGPIGHERGWVFSIARNVLLDRGRAERRQPSGPAAAEPAAAATQALAFGLAEALAGLSDDDRNVFLLKEVGGLTYAGNLGGLRVHDRGRQVPPVPDARVAPQDVGRRVLT